MGTVALIFRADANLDDLPQDWVPEPLGMRDEVRRIVAAATGLDATGRHDLRASGLELELDVDAEDAPRTIGVYGVFGDAEMDLLRTLCDALSARLYDSEEAGFIV